MRKNDVSEEVLELERRLFGHFDTSYVTALQLLETDASKEFKIKYAEEIAKKKEAVKKSVLDHLDAELKDEKTDASRYLLTRTLQDAVNLGMHKEQDVIAPYANIPELILNVPKYITVLCAKHGIQTE